MNDAYEEWARRNGVKVHTSLQGEDGIRVSSGDDAWFEVRLRPRTLDFLEHSREAAVLRLDAPLLESALDASAPLRVTLGVQGLPPEAPDQVRRARMKLEPEPDSGAILVQLDVSKTTVAYSLTPPIGVYDLNRILEDALLLAEPVEEEDCHGSHDAPESGAAAPHDDRLRRALLLQHQLCESCVDTLLATGVPLAPRAPKEWE